MKKVLLTKDVKRLIAGQYNFLNRSDITVVTASTNAEALKIHREEKVDLIVTQLETPGIGSEKIFAIIRDNEELRGVSTIIIWNTRLPIVNAASNAGPTRSLPCLSTLPYSSSKCSTS